MVRCWLMWRLPQIVDTIKGSSGLKFHLCASYRDLVDNFHRVFILPDLLSIGQCGHVLRREMLQYEHSFDRPWPNTDGTHPSLAAIGGKEDRPIVDGVLQFLYEWVRPLSPSGTILFAPFTSMLAGSNPTSLSAETIRNLLDIAASEARPEGLPGKTIGDAMARAARELSGHTNGTVIPLEVSGSSSESNNKSPRFDPAQMELKYGRYFWPDEPISQPDPSWGSADILAFEFLVADQLQSMLVVAGEWCNSVPMPSHELNLRIPYVEGVSAPVLAEAIKDDPESFREFRHTMSDALLEAMNVRGSEAFSAELRRIQNNIVDSGVSKLNRKWKELSQKRLARLGQYTVKTVGVTVGLYFTFTPAALAGLFSTALGSVLAEREKRVGENAALKDNPMYFIWTLGR